VELRITLAAASAFVWFAGLSGGLGNDAALEEEEEEEEDPEDDDAFMPGAACGSA